MQRYRVIAYFATSQQTKTQTNKFSMYTRIEVFFKNEFPDPLGNNIRSEIETFGFHGVSNIRVRQVYIIFGNFKKNDLDTIAQKLLVDTITQHYQSSDSGLCRERSV